MATNLDAHKCGDTVRVQPLDPLGVWKTAQVVRPVDHRLYEVKIESGGVLRRNDDTIHQGVGLGVFYHVGPQPSKMTLLIKPVVTRSGHQMLKYL